MSLIHNFYRGVLPSGENLSVSQHPDMMEPVGVDVSVLSCSNRGWEASRVQAAAEVVAASAGTRSSIRRWVDRVRAEDASCVHIENLVPMISDALPSELVRAGFPVLRRWRSFRFRCPSGTNFRAGKVCRDCERQTKAAAVVHRCYSGSLFGSAAVAIRRGHPLDPAVLHVPTSRFMANALLDAGVSADRIEMIPNWVPGAAQTPLPLDARVPEVVYLGVLNQKKGIPQLLDMWSHVSAQSDLRLRIIGEGPLRADIEAAAALDASIIVEGRLDYETARARIAKAVAVIAPSAWEEPFGRVAIEAMAEGTPSIVSDRGALAEVAGNLGSVIDPDNAEESARAILDLASTDHDTFAGLTAQSVQRFNDTYSAEAVRARWVDLYQRLAPPSS